jgi:hypothetical protein
MLALFESRVLLIDIRQTETAQAPIEMGLADQTLAGAEKIS